MNEQLDMKLRSFQICLTRISYAQVCALRTARARARAHGFRVTEGGEQFKLPHPPTPSLENNLSPKDGGTPECPLCLFQSLGLPEPGLLAFHGGSTWPACSPCPVHCNPSKAAARHPMAASLPRLLFHTNSNSGAYLQASKQVPWLGTGAIPPFSGVH